MRSSTRFHTICATALIALVASAVPAAAQGTANQDLRTDSWYWGAYGGQTSLATSLGRTSASMFGAEWVITRNRFALNVFADQSSFNAVSTVQFNGNARHVNIQDMRRLGFAGMFFLPPYKYFHPWAGAGYSFNMIRQATPVFSAQDTAGTRDALAASVNNATSSGRLFGEFGMMVTYKKIAPFVQYTVMPSQGSGSWLVNGDGFTNIWKAGIRYSFGSSIEERW